MYVHKIVLRFICPGSGSSEKQGEAEPTYQDVRAWRGYVTPLPNFAFNAFFILLADLGEVRGVNLVRLMISALYFY